MAAAGRIQRKYHLTGIRIISNLLDKLVLVPVRPAEGESDPRCSTPEILLSGPGHGRFDVTGVDGPGRPSIRVSA